MKRITCFPGMKNIPVNIYDLALKASQNNITEYYGIVNLNDVHYSHLSYILLGGRWRKVCRSGR